MRTLIDIPDQQLNDLASICATQRLARAEAVRRALNAFIAQNLPTRETAFGAWNGQIAFLPGEREPLPEDGLAYQEKLRSEW